jgi:NADPH:quinone reductase-like Zn-dependent oxidoreductase
MIEGTSMKAARIYKFAPPSVIVVEDLPRPTPGRGEGR